ncbi:hypothetical protein [Glycomyces buryatensis]|uniref:PH domain-containing protein n=1 Tax=Glycomyces buryatensis TaxID=2570927 RepID=A0A4S8QEN0_9ACTN|nr:hypothetical protein [Glycomyces buryatensis]THV41552.1 hypothetical protein FAB82_10610 [Glycomyces buryatensis]
MRRSSEWVVVERSSPARRISSLVLYALVCAAGIAALAWLVHTEPGTLDSGEANPVVALPGFFTVIALIGTVFFLAPLVRPPMLFVNHFGLRVRPSFGKVLLIPWSNVEELAAITVGSRRRGQSYLLLAADVYLGRGGSDRPGFIDRSVLREANRATEGLVAGFDLAIRCKDFEPKPDQLLARLASYAPGHVQVVDRF